MIALVLVLIPVGWSYSRALLAPGTDPWNARTVEWLRDHGMSGVVDSIEHWWFTTNAPPVGGRPAHGLPHGAAPKGSAVPKLPKPFVADKVPHLASPTNMVPLASPPLAN